jgi:hypothetical protein
MTELKPTTTVEKTILNKIRIKRLAAFLALFAYVPIMLLINLFVKSEKGMITTGIIYLLCWSFLGLSLSFAKCPRCHENFFWTWRFANPLASKCQHCGLRIKEQ